MLRKIKVKKIKEYDSEDSVVLSFWIYKTKCITAHAVPIDCWSFLNMVANKMEAFLVRINIFLL